MKVVHPELLPRTGLAADWLQNTIAACLDEDLGGSPGLDVTSAATLDPEQEVAGAVVARAPGVVAGVDIVAATFAQVAQRFGLPLPQVQVLLTDGSQMQPGNRLVTFRGVAPVVMIGERTLLNLMSRAAGVASHTRRWVEGLAGSGTQIVDTRKTTPLLRELDKYAVRCGGGVNKRFGLFDCAMIKDNHIVAAGSLTAAIRAIRDKYPQVPIQVEVEDFAQVNEALDQGIDFLMLDNMPPQQMQEIVAWIRAREEEIGKIWVEATGGLTLNNVADVAATGVDYVSVGALTHSSPIIDLGLDLD